MPGPRIGGAPTVSLRDLARPLTGAELEALRAKKEQEALEAQERERTHAARKACTGMQDFLKRCDTYPMPRPRTSFARASRLVAARGQAAADTLAHIVPPANDAETRLKKAACGTAPGEKTRSIGWGRTVSMATCKWCLLAAGEPRIGCSILGTGDRFRCT